MEVALKWLVVGMAFVFVVFVIASVAWDFKASMNKSKVKKLGTVSPSLKSVVGVVPTYSQWRADEARVGIAAQLLSSEAAREMVQVLRADPVHKSYLVQPNDAQGAVAAYWYRRGYDLALNSLEKLGELLEAPKDPGEPTYEAED